MPSVARRVRTGQNARMTLGSRIAAAVGAFVACVIAMASVARADGDPASDYLVARQVFVSSQQVAESPAQRRLITTVGAANRAGYSIRVAVISSDYDLGSITALWRRPALYARFLGLELAASYKGRLLVVMPNGFGVFWAGRRTSREHAAIAKLAIVPGEAGLLQAAQTAVRRLAADDGVVIASSTDQTTAPGARGGGSVSILDVAAALVAVAVLVIVALALTHRRSGRKVKVSGDSPASAITVRRLRLAVALPGFAALCAMAVAAPILALRGVRHGSGSLAAQAASIVTPPARSWPAARRPAPNFNLVDQDGRGVSVAAYRGRPVIVTFIDPLCRNLCPLEAKVLNQAVSKLPERERPEILAVSVDVYAGANRRPNLRRDVGKWELVPQWRWAVGSAAQLAAVWRRYEVGVKVTARKVAGTTIHYVTHTEAAFVVDPSGYERALFLWPFYPQDVERALQTLG
jgi:protein SCO1